MPMTGQNAPANMAVMPTMLNPALTLATVPMPPAALASRLDQFFDFGRRQIFPISINSE